MILLEGSLQRKIWGPENVCLTQMHELWRERACKTGYTSGSMDSSFQGQAGFAKTSPPKPSDTSDRRLGGGSTFPPPEAPRSVWTGGCPRTEPRGHELGLFNLERALVPDSTALAGAGPLRSDGELVPD